MWKVECVLFEISEGYILLYVYYDIIWNHIFDGDNFQIATLRDYFYLENCGR